MELFSKIQFGFDIATSISILFAAGAFIISSSYKLWSERRRGINDRVKSKALEKVLDIQRDFEDAFRVIVHNGLKYERIVDNCYEAGNLSEKLNVESFLKDRIGDVARFRESLDDYYELIQSRRYTLVPVLDSVPEQKDFLKRFLVDINEIGAAHNEIASCQSLIKELLDVRNFFHDYKDCDSKSDEDKISDFLSKDEFRKAFYSIILDKDYLFWTVRLVRDEYKNNFVKKENDSSFNDEDHRELHIALLNFTAALLNDPNQFLSEAIFLCSKKFQDARQECKDIVLKLAAITGFLLSKNEKETLEVIIEKYESNEYFGRNMFIR